MVAHFARDYTKIWKCAAIFSAKILLMSPVIAQHECLRACARCAVRSVRHRALGHNFSFCCFFFLSFAMAYFWTWNLHLESRFIRGMRMSRVSTTNTLISLVNNNNNNKTTETLSKAVDRCRVNFVYSSKSNGTERNFFFFLATRPIFSSASWSRECKWRETHQWGWLNVCHHFRKLPDIARINIKMYIFSLYI